MCQLQSGPIAARPDQDAEAARHIKLKYPVDFPEVFSSKLPPIWGGCYCPSCASDLWDSLAPHPQPHPNEDGTADVMYSGLDIRQLLSTLMSHLEQISEHLAKRELLTANEKSAIGDMMRSAHAYVEFMKFRDSIAPYDQRGKDPKDLQRCRNPPLLETLAEPMNRLWFGGLLKVKSYGWQYHREIFGLATHDGRTVRLNPTILWGTETFAGKKPLERGLQLLTVLLHEQVHAFFSGNKCDGNCNGTKEQQQLCRFLTARVCSMYRQIEYKGHVINNQLFGGHGPAFTAVAWKIGSVMGKFLNCDVLLVGPYFMKHCRCKGPVSCLTHCYISEEEQRMGFARALRNELAERDRQASGA
ncbi:hypothetical protein K505DRAFT_390594 [Melanomma pulvis-pyrius CBS 109.77]|uniref:SprT-like domain-containing protein n=1 Tax=Melanomma pulvis-pyrius CBS 109.77 TaxID=1314802 RepID=A0A6A6X2W8_9PLEO|nr:hypothetical protein K505DRAFT_390594 [Melanomma pulvis-pyrius CBS 109.77]